MFKKIMPLSKRGKNIPVKEYKSKRLQGVKGSTSEPPP